MHYAEHLHKRIKRHKEFHSSPDPMLLVVLWGVGPPENWRKKLSDYDFEKEGPKARVLDEIDYWKGQMEKRAGHGIDDDMVYTWGFNFGTGFFDAWLTDAEVYFSGDTSWSVHEPLESLGAYGKYKLDPENRWIKFQKEAICAAMEANDGSYLVASGYSPGPSDIANALRGNDFFTDVYDDPEGTKRLLDFSAEASLWMENEFFPIAGEQLGGTPLYGGHWIPGHAVGASADAANLVSPQIYREVLFDADAKLFSRHSTKGIMHFHSLGMHLAEEFIRLPNLFGFQPSNDPSHPFTPTDMEKLCEMSRQVAIYLGASPEFVRENIRYLKEGRFILGGLGGQNEEESKALIDFVRENSGRNCD